MKHLLLSSFILFSCLVFGQQTVNHHVDFASGRQNMWGPSFNAFNINRTITLFETNWNTGYNSGSGGIVSVAGFDFGGGLNAGTSGQIGSTFTLSGFTTGEVEVDYPIDVTLDMPTDLTYNQGDEVSIATSYTVDPTAALNTFYPSVGEARLDFYFRIAMNLQATLCAFSCTTFDLFPPFDTGVINLNIFKADASGVEYLGPACPLSPKPGGMFGPCSDCGGSGCFPWRVREDFIPVEIPDNDYGISGELTIPYVPTTDNIVNGKCLTASGDSTYVTLSLEILKLLGNFVPPPAGPILQNLSGELPLPLALSNFGANASYNIFSASFNAYLTNNQDFKFDPEVYGKFNFPTPVTYRILDTLGAQYTTGLSAEVDFIVGETVFFDFPCFYEDLTIVPTYSIDPEFSNRTYDVVSFDFQMSAMEFALNLPSITVVPEICFPEVCVSIPYPCPSWSNPGRWCSKRVCTPAFCTPEISSPSFSFGFGPLFSYTLPIAAVDYDWYNNTWDLEGFEDSIFVGFTMSARPFSAASTHVDVLCKNGNNGSINVTTTNGTAPITYAWDSGQTSEDIATLTAGSYNAVITDANGCQVNTGAVISEPGNVVLIELTSTDKLCNGGVNNGTINSMVSGGTPPYTYSWSNTATSPNISGLDIGTYTLTVTDANGCTAMMSADVAQPRPLNDSIVTITSVNCNGANDGIVNVIMNGGELPYNFVWSNGNTDSYAEDLSAGNYTMTVTDGNACVFNNSYNVAEPVAPITLATTSTPITCFGTNTGTIDLTVNGGTAPYTFTWSNSGAQVLNQTTEDVNGLAADTYSVIVTDSKGCLETTSQMIGGPTSPVTGTASLTDVDCNGASTGAIDFTPVGGVGGFTYNWSNGASSQDLTGIVAGNYTVTVSDANGCSETYTYAIDEPDYALNTTFVVADVKCFGEATGSINTETTGGTLPFSYSWASGQTTDDLTGLAANTYTLTVTDGNGCQTIINPVVNEPAAPLQLSETHVDVLCFGGNNGSIDLTVVGGTAPYTYSWSNSNSITLEDDTEDLSMLEVDTYLVVVTDNNNCTEQLFVTIDGPTDPIAITSVLTDVDCFGNNTGAIDITVTGGTAGYMFSWLSGQSTEDLTNITSGDYTVTVTDNNNCVENHSASITQPEAPLSGIVQTTRVKCFGESTGSADLTVNGGTAPYTYLWSNGAVTEDLSIIPSGAYNVTITDANGCTAFTGGFVGQPANPLAVGITVTDPSCFKYSDGTIELNVTGGTTPYTFEWGNQVQYQLNNPSETLNDVSSGEYLMRVTDKEGCEFEQLVTVNEPDTIAISAQVFDALCFNSSDGDIDITVVGGTTPYNYNWSNSATTEDLTNVLAGDYTVEVIDDQGCRFESSYVVNQPIDIVINSEVTAVSCIDQTDGTITVQTAGGTQPYSWTWSTGEFTQNVQDLSPGMYSLTITDANGCVKNYDFIIPENNAECLEIPNTITPNGDGYNDVWNIRNLDLYPQASVQIYNRWGNLLYESNNGYTPWDGKANGADLPAEVYYYVIVLSNDQENKYTGTITIIR